MMHRAVKTAEPIEMLFGLWTRVGGPLGSMCYRWVCTLAPPGDFCQVTLATCYY